MAQNRLTKAVLRRLKELGLPVSLVDIDAFRDRFFFHQWVMFVRDGDHITDVHLVQPQSDAKSLNRGRVGPRRKRGER